MGAGIGVTLVPEMAIAGERTCNPGVTFRPFDAGGPSRSIGVAWRKSSAREAEFKALAETIRAAHLTS